MTPRRLLLRIYLVTLAQFLAVGIAYVVIHASFFRPHAPPFRPGRPEDFAVRSVADRRDDPAALRAELERIRRDFGLHMTLYDRGGSLLGSTHDPVPPPLTSAHLAELEERPAIPGERPHTVAVGIRDGEVLTGYGIVDLVGPPPRFEAIPFIVIGVVVLFVLVGSVFFARALATPLGKIAEVARAFGRGQLDARVRLARKDELGEVADAFDDMADRVTGLLRGQRELVANVSHELRTPLARIRVALDLAAEGDAEAARAALADITEDWGDLDRLVEDLLVAARLELGDNAAPRLRLERVEVAPLLERAAARFRVVHPTLELSIDEELPSIDADPAMLRRVVDNLLVNAHKYSDLASAVTLSARSGGSGVVIEVADRGIGIDAADVPQIFTPFFRTDRSRARSTGGAGLGLALAKRIVEAHGGTITLESAAHVGTTLRVSLPTPV